MPGLSRHLLLIIKNAVYSINRDYKLYTVMVYLFESIIKGKASLNVVPLFNSDSREIEP